MLYICIGFVIIMIPFFLSGASFNLGLGPLLRFGISHERKYGKGNSLHSLENREPVQIILKVIYNFPCFIWNVLFLTKFIPDLIGNLLYVVV